jgi:hypothetical protein
MHKSLAARRAARALFERDEVLSALACAFYRARCAPEIRGESRDSRRFGYRVVCRYGSKFASAGSRVGVRVLALDATTVESGQRRAECIQKTAPRRVRAGDTCNGGPIFPVAPPIDNDQQFSIPDTVPIPCTAVKLPWAWGRSIRP